MLSLQDPALWIILPHGAGQGNAGGSLFHDGQITLASMPASACYNRGRWRLSIEDKVSLGSDLLCCLGKFRGAQPLQEIPRC